MTGTCPNCRKMVDADGFFEHGLPTLWYCYCGRVYTYGSGLRLIEVLKAEIDLTAGFPYGNRVTQPGQFIIALRWQKVREAAEKTMKEVLADLPVPHRRSTADIIMGRK